MPLETRSKPRMPAVAGVFYPEDAKQLRETVENLVSNANLQQKILKRASSLKAIVSPHAGYPYSGPTAGFGYALLRERERAGKNPVSKVVCVGPSHYALFQGVAEPDCSEWVTPLGSVKALSLRGENAFSQFVVASREAHAREHCLEVQLPFLQTTLEKFEFAGLLTSEVSPNALGDALATATIAGDDRTIIIASSDLSHYHSYEQARALDALANKSIPALELQAAQSVEACGKTAILALMHCAKKLGWHGEFLDYRNSGDTAGDKTAVVGYGCYAFFE